MSTLTRSQYVERYGPMATEACRDYPELYPSVLLAQAIVESNNGNSRLAIQGNNHFGIKAIGGWKGDTITFPTKEYLSGRWVTVQAAFRKYPTVTDSFRDRNAFLKRNPRYTKHGVFAPRLGPDGQCDSIQKSACSVEGEVDSIFFAGYATDPQYAHTLKQIIRKYNLTRFDPPAVRLAVLPPLPDKPSYIGPVKTEIPKFV